MNKIKKGGIGALLCALFAFGSVISFNNKEENVNVHAEAPENNVVCPQCNGKGRISEGCYYCKGTGVCSFCENGVCDGCYGEKEGVCHYCEGEGTCGPCFDCEGTGNMDCFFCEGTGIDYSGETCCECSGSGKITCDYCHGTGIEICSNCSGTGYGPCWLCDGTGICFYCKGTLVCIYCPKCPTCSGTGKMPTPSFNASNSCFVGNLEVKFNGLPSGVTIYYSLNEEVTDGNGVEYTGPVTVTESSIINHQVTVYAVAKKDGTTSVMVSKTFYEVYAGQTFTHNGFKYEITNTNPNEVKVINDENYKTLNNAVTIPTTAIYEGFTFNVTGIGANAFKDSGLTSITIPKEIKEIDDSAFEGCNNLSYIAVKWDNGSGFPTVGNDVFKNIDEEAVLSAPDESSSSYRTLVEFKDLDYYERVVLTDLLGAEFPTNFADGLANESNEDVKVYLDDGLQLEIKDGLKYKAILDEDSLINRKGNYEYNDLGVKYFFTFKDGAFDHLEVSGASGNKEAFNGTYFAGIKTLDQVFEKFAPDFPTTKENGWVCNNANKLYIKDSKIYINNTMIADFNDEINVDTESGYTVYTTSYGNYEAKIYILDNEIAKIVVTDSGTTGFAGTYNGPTLAYLYTYFTNFPVGEDKAFVNNNGVKIYLSLTFLKVGDDLFMLTEPIFYENGMYVCEKDDARIEFHFSGKTITSFTISGYTGEKAVNNGSFKTRTKIEKPTENNGTFVYTGEAQTYNIKINDNAYTITGNVQTSVGTYTVTVSLKDKNATTWEDGTTDDLTFTFEIGKGVGEIILDNDTIVSVEGEPVEIPTLSSNFGTVTSSKTGELSDVGVYEITYTLEGTNSYSGDTKTLKIIINKKTIEEPVNENGQKVEDPFVKIIDSRKGINPNAELVIKEIGMDETEKVGNVETILKNDDFLNEEDKIYGIYDVKLVADSAEIQPDGYVTIKMNIPEELRGSEFDIYHIHTKEDGTTEVSAVSNIHKGDTYVTFEINSLSQFVFVATSQAAEACWAHTVMISILFIGAALFILFVLIINKKLAGLITAALGLIASIVLAFFGNCGICTVFIIINIVAFLAGIVFLLLTTYKDKIVSLFKKEKAPKQEENNVEEESKVAEEIKAEEPVIEETEVEEVKEEQPKEEVKESSLKESMEKAASSGTKGIAQKDTVAKYLQEKYGEEVEINNRPSTTKPGKGKTVGLPLADTHYTLKNGQRKCFVYVYDVDGNSLLIVKVPQEYGESLKKNHNLVSKSAFPKTRDASSWYSVPVDETWNEARLCKLLDDAKMLVEDPNAKVGDEPELGLSLKESMKVAAFKGIKGGAQKDNVSNYLKEKYGDEVETNNRPATTKPGKGKSEGLPLPDTHYTLKNGQRKCFVYVYDVKGSTLFLIKAPNEYAEELKKKHELVSKSAFPKTRDGAMWYSVTIDDSWDEESVNRMLDEVKKLNE